MRALTGAARPLWVVILLLIGGCVEPRVYDGVIGVQVKPTCPSFELLLEAKRGTRELSVYEVNEHGRTTEKLWRIRAGRERDTLASVCYGQVPQGYTQDLPPAAEPRSVGPGLYAAVALVAPMPFWDYYYFRMDDQRRVQSLKKDPGHFEGIVFTEDGSP